jgi:hypothetical protein
MKHESFCEIPWKKGLGIAAGNHRKPNFESEGPCPFFSWCQKLLGQDSTPHVSDQTNNKSWRDDLVAKKESTSVQADRASRSEQRPKGLLLLLSEIPGAFWPHLQIPKDQCLSAVQSAISLDGFVSLMEAIEILCKDTDDIGVMDEIGGCQVYGRRSHHHQRFHSKSMQLCDLNKNEGSKPGLLALSELLIDV